MKVATPAQIGKLIGLLMELIEEVSCDVLQKALGSPHLRHLLRTGELPVLEEEKERVRSLWHLIVVLTNFEDIFITIPHDTFRDTDRFQVRVWKGKWGETSIGKVENPVDGQNYLLEVMIKGGVWEDDATTTASKLYKRHGIGSYGHQPIKEVRESHDTSKYDVLTFAPMVRSCRY